MYSQSEVSGVYDFLNSTAEGNLRRMLVSDSMTDTYFRVLLKIGKFCTEADFADAFYNETMPAIKLSAKEKEAREFFWGVCKKRLEEVGLLGIIEQKAA